MSIHAHTYTNVILRIALYSFASCVINLTSISIVIYSTSTNGIQNANDYHILLLSDFLYGGRAIVYALLAATDPVLVRAVRAFVAHHMDWHWENTMTARTQTTTIARSTASRARREDLTGQVKLSTIVARDYADGGPKASPANDTKIRDVEPSAEASSFGAAAGSVDEDNEVLTPATDKAERGALADLDAEVDTNGPPLNPPRPVAFELSSHTTDAEYAPSTRGNGAGAGRRERVHDDHMNSTLGCL